jgi:hypothetical protein
MIILQHTTQLQNPYTYSALRSVQRTTNRCSRNEIYRTPPVALPALAPNKNTFPPMQRVVGPAFLPVTHVELANSTMITVPTTTVILVPVEICMFCITIVLVVLSTIMNHSTVAPGINSCRQLYTGMHHNKYRY